MKTKMEMTMSNNNDNNSLYVYENDNNCDGLIDELAESIEYLSRTTPTTMPEWMD